MMQTKFKTGPGQLRARHCENLDELMEAWDRGEWGKFTRRLEILLLRGENEKAQRALQSFSGWVRSTAVSLQDSVYDVLPMRLATAMEQAGYNTLIPIAAASDEELLAVRNIDRHSLRVIRTAIEAAEQGQRLERFVERNQPDLAPEWEIDWEYLAATCSCSGACQSVIAMTPPAGDGGNCTTPTKERAMGSINEKLSHNLAAMMGLMEDSDRAVEQIDTEIASLQADIAKLQRLRDVIQPPPPKPKRNSGTRLRADTDVSSQVEQITHALQKSGGPKKPKELQEMTGIPYTMIGKYVDASRGRLVRDGKLIALGT